MKRYRKWLLKPADQYRTEELQLGEEERNLTSEIDRNEKLLKDIFRNCSDIVFRKIRVAGHLQWLVVFIKSLVDEKMIDEHVIKSLVKNDNTRDEQFEEVEILDDQMVSAANTNTTGSISEIVRLVLMGYAVVLTAGDSNALTVTVSGLDKRTPEEPTSEPVIRGPREGFIEHISTNIGLIRRRIKTPRLKTESFTIGEISQTQVVVAYIEGIASDAVVEEVRKRVSRIRIDGVLESNYIEEFIEDYPYSPFPQVHSTERPDVVSAELLEGKVSILVDTSPFVLIVPMTFWTGMQASEDYYIRWPIATFVRWIRFMFATIAVLAPPLYVAVTTFHQEMIPTSLVLSIATAREPVPFPALVEALLMEITFEALREAGIRLPMQIGQAISIVGALVIGQAAVQAGIISAPVVIIVSITGIAAFTIPRYSFANGIRLLRFPLLLLAGTLGLYGIAIGILGILAHVASLRSFGVPYFSPVAPLTLRELKDVFIRTPFWAKTRRPQSIAANDSIRRPPGQKPSPNRGE
ncbi:spore germination protein [Paenibacillus sp. MWE-103]|uniref:Spore germination protein n=1 Tax=Paenibacillus artemisiicola TaxID=1172618 RepID=A0ABS3W649_9BACL|nr:spore germination protein [Paenibacillus artemisiicola]MBO7743790.1 spore germination protein [Paenibacillus artemisiicola]